MVKGQPKALVSLFFTEMWERFSYYGMRALLVLYLVQSENFTEFEALKVYAIYTGLVYVTPIFGGYFADRFLGYNKAIIIGGFIMILGHFLMAFPNFLYLAMGLLIIGNGFFKPNISTLLGNFYSKTDPKRDAGFSFFYVGINLGAFMSPLIIGYVGETIDWHLGFSLAAAGMCLGLIQYLYHQNKIIQADKSNQTKKLKSRDWFEIAFISLSSIPFVYLCIEINYFFKQYWAEILLGLIFLLIIKLSYNKNNQRLSSEELKRIIYISTLSIFVIFFWMGFEQAGGSLTIFANNNVDRRVGEYLIPVTFFQSINPLIIIFLGPVIANFWLKVDSAPNHFSTPQKMSLGLLFLGLGFLILVLIKDQSNISFTWLILVYFLHTVGELCLSPIGLSMVSKVSPKKIASLLMGLWFLSAAAANYFAGRLPEMVKQFEGDLFLFLTFSSIISAIILFLIAPFLEKLINKK